MSSRRWIVSRTLLMTAVLAALAGVVVLFAPMHEIGVTGSAAWPHYRSFGWVATEPLPPHPTARDFRNAGIVTPQSRVSHRRDEGRDLLL